MQVLFQNSWTISQDICSLISFYCALQKSNYTFFVSFYVKKKKKIFKRDYCHFFCCENCFKRWQLNVLMQRSRTLIHSLWVLSDLVVSNCLHPMDEFPARLFCQWDYPGKNSPKWVAIFSSSIFDPEIESAYVSCVARWVLYR